MGRKNYPPREKKKRKVEARTKIGQELIAGLKEIVQEVQPDPEKPKLKGRASLGGLPPWKKKLAESFKKRRPK